MSKLIIYGLHAAKEAWNNPKRKIMALHATQNVAKDFKPIAGRPQPKIVARAQIDKITPRDAVHQGVALECAELQEVDVSDFNAINGGTVLMLDQVTDPHNIGAILRSACAFGASALVLQKRRAPSMDGVLAKAASGALEHIDIALPTNLSRALETLKDGGFTVIGLDEMGRNIKEIPKFDKKVIVLGAEGAGIRRLVKENCDFLVKLPTTGVISTLNVSNAAVAALALI